VQRGIFTHYQWLVILIQWLLDGLMVVLLLAVLALAYGVPFENQYHLLAALAFILTLLVFRAAQLYRPWRGVDFIRLGQRVLVAWVIVLGLLLALAFVTKTTTYFSRGVLLPWIFLTPLVLLGLRLLVYKSLGFLRSYGHNTRTAVIAGAGTLGQHLARSLVDLPWLGIRFLGFFDDQKLEDKVDLAGGLGDHPVLGDLDSMVSFIRDFQVNIVYLALPLKAQDRLRDIIEKLQDTTASVYFTPDVFIYALFQSSLTDLRGIPLISL
jgi:putative colanic acid biosynthesis UDP-glucose lipid carrier transferase